MPETYDRNFFQQLQEGSSHSASQVAPLLMDLFHPRSVVDVGCGVGDWLAALAELGVDEVLGIDGGWVDRSLLKIPRESFMAYDLSTPLKLDRRFDLVLSLEVGEHLPPMAAPLFVKSLVSLGPCVVFSAAVPHQGGTNHINEQWPQYWAALFAQHDYLAIDCIRRRLWNDPLVSWWFAQNTILYIDRAMLGSYAAVQQDRPIAPAEVLSLIHPRKYMEISRKLATAPHSLGLRRTAAALPGMVWEKMRSRRKLTTPRNNP